MIVLDTESYPNWWLLAFLDTDSGKTLMFELEGAETSLADKDRRTIARIMQARRTVSFNGQGYDLPIIVHALKGATAGDINRLSQRIIGSKLPAWKVAQAEGVSPPRAWTHVDLMPIAPGKCSLKMYAARLGLESIADLPYPPDQDVDADQVAELKAYCVGDLRNTAALGEALAEEIALRERLSEDYKTDLLSSSDATIAERVIVSEVRRLGGKPKKRPAPDRCRLKDPGFVEFRTPELQRILEELLEADFVVNSHGNVCLPEGLEGRKVELGSSTYKMGIGGLHSTEKGRTLHADDEHALIDLDVASYYPAIILQQRLSPAGVGPKFLAVYQRLVARRLEAKAAGDKVSAGSLKIVVNATFGKLGNKYAALYAPHLFVQVTVIGQLALLMLIERLEAVGVPVVSANTDGVVVRCPRSRLRELERVAWEWMLDTSFELERAEYRTLLQRDVNSYIAVGVDGSIKRKGAYGRSGLGKNPQFDIVADAVTALAAHGTPVAKTIHDCDDLRPFLATRRVTGGAVWRDQELGRTVRWYLSNQVWPGEVIRYVKNSNTVPQSAGGRPVAALPESMPEDVDRQLYVHMANKALKVAGWVDA